MNKKIVLCSFDKITIKLILVLISMLPFQPLAKASVFNSDQEDRTKNWFTTLKSYGHHTLSLMRGEDAPLTKKTRNWQKQLFNACIGTAIYSASYAITHYNLSQISGMIGLSLIVASTTKMLRYGGEWYASEVSKAQASSSPKKKRKEGKILSENIQKSIDQNIQFTRVIFEQTRNLGNIALKFNMLYTLVRFYDVENLSLLGMVATRTAYDLYEIGYTYSTGETRNNIPLMGLLDSYCKIVNSISLYLSWLEEGLDPLSLSTPLKFLIFQGLKTHGETGLNIALLQMGWNLMNSVYSYFIPSSSLELPHKNEALLPLVSPKKYSPQRIKSLSLSESVLPISLLSSPQNLAPSPAPKKDSPKISIQPKKKVKTKGIPQENVPASGPTIHSPIKFSESDQQRNEALERLEDLRHSRVVKKTEIDQEINLLESFFPAVSVRKAGHGKKAITVNGNEFRAFFEPSHGKQKVSKDEYQGYCKQRILDALQLIYLYGWDKDKILAFMEAHDKISFYNVPHSLMHILWDRGRYE